MDDPSSTGVLTGIGALLSALGAFLRAEVRTGGVVRRIEALEMSLEGKAGTLMPRELCIERHHRIDESISHVSHEVAELRKDVRDGFVEVKAMIKAGGRSHEP